MVLMFYALLVGSVVNSSNIFANLKQIVRITKEYALKHVLAALAIKRAADIRILRLGGVRIISVDL